MSPRLVRMAPSRWLRVAPAPRPAPAAHPLRFRVGLSLTPARVVQVLLFPVALVPQPVPVALPQPSPVAWSEPALTARSQWLPVAPPPKPAPAVPALPFPVDLQLTPVLVGQASTSPAAPSDLPVPAERPAAFRVSAVPPSRPPE
ncbi:MAG: hypothetical protein ABWY45_13665 [Mycobacterium sp.]